MVKSGFWKGFEWVLNEFWKGFEWVLKEFWKILEMVKYGFWKGFEWVLNGFWKVLNGFWKSFEKFWDQPVAPLACSDKLRANFRLIKLISNYRTIWTEIFNV